MKCPNCKKEFPEPKDIEEGDISIFKIYFKSKKDPKDIWALDTIIMCQKCGESMIKSLSDGGEFTYHIRLTKTLKDDLALDYVFTNEWPKKNEKKEVT